jgi:ABC-2 type transport system ATP-binding protein
MDRYVANDTSVDTGPGFDVIDQDGVRYTATSYAEAAGTPLTASGSGTLELTAEGGSGPTVIPEGTGSVLSGLVESITPAFAQNAVNLPLVVKGGPDLVLGAPELSLSYSGSNGTDGRPTRVFAQLVDASTSLVIGNQITPIAVVLDGAKHQVRVPLEVIAFAAKPGATITLQIVASTVAYAAPQFGGRISFDSIDLSLPVVAAGQMKRDPA